jgi:hypothetical protein
MARYFPQETIMVLKALAGGFSFAHFAGLGRSSKKGAASEDLRDQDDAAPAAAAETEDCEEDAETEEGASDAAGKKGGKKSDKKDDDEDETSEGEEDGDDEDEDEDEEASEEGTGKGKKAAVQPAKPAAAAPAKSGKSEFKRGKKAERRRIGLILSNPAAASNLPFACKLACNTGMSSSAAIALLEQTPAAPVGRGGRLDSAMAGAKVPDVKAGSPEGPKGDAAISASWDVAMKSVAPVKK